MSNLDDVFRNVGWKLLADQKHALIRVMSDPLSDPVLEGLLTFLDAVQEAAEKDGLPVIWLGMEEPDGDVPL